MAKLDQTIEKIVTDTKPLAPLRPAGSTFLVWAGVTLAATFLLMMFSSFRPDLVQQLNSPLFLTEIAVLGALILSTGAAAAWLAVPDMQQKRWVLAVPLPFLTLYICLLIYRALHPELNAVLPEPGANGFDCVLCISLYALVPGFWMFFALKRRATVHPRLAGALCLLAAASIGVLVLKFVEPNDAVEHLLMWHLLPVGLLGTLGMWLGRKFLAW